MRARAAQALAGWSHVRCGTESEHITTLLRVAEYLSRPQQFVAVAEAPAAFGHVLDMAHQASVVLTTNGVPVGALVSFATREAMRGALQHLLVEAMETSFA